MNRRRVFQTKGFDLLYVTVEISALYNGSTYNRTFKLVGSEDGWNYKVLSTITTSSIDLSYLYPTSFEKSFMCLDGDYIVTTNQDGVIARCNLKTYEWEYSSLLNSGISYIAFKSELFGGYYGYNYSNNTYKIIYFNTYEDIINRNYVTLNIPNIITSNKNYGFYERDGRLIIVLNCLTSNPIYMIVNIITNGTTFNKCCTILAPTSTSYYGMDINPYTKYPLGFGYPSFCTDKYIGLFRDTPKTKSMIYLSPEFIKVSLLDVYNAANNSVLLVQNVTGGFDIQKMCEAYSYDPHMMFLGITKNYAYFGAIVIDRDDDDTSDRSTHAVFEPLYIKYPLSLFDKTSGSLTDYIIIRPSICASNYPDTSIYYIGDYQDWLDWFVYDGSEYVNDFVFSLIGENDNNAYEVCIGNYGKYTTVIGPFSYNNGYADYNSKRTICRPNRILKIPENYLND